MNGDSVFGLPQGRFPSLRVEGTDLDVHPHEVLAQMCNTGPSGENRILIHTNLSLNLEKSAQHSAHLISCLHCPCTSEIPTYIVFLHWILSAQTPFLRSHLPLLQDLIQMLSSVFFSATSFHPTSVTPCSKKLVLSVLSVPWYMLCTCEMACPISCGHCAFSTRQHLVFFTYQNMHTMAQMRWMLLEHVSTSERYLSLVWFHWCVFFHFPCRNRGEGS